MYLHNDLELFRDVIRATSAEQNDRDLCLSAKPDVNINELLKKIEGEAYFRDDYKSINSIFQNTPLAYEEAIKIIKIIIDSRVFDA